MFWFNQSKKNAADVQRLMARIINGQFTSNELLMESPDRDARTSSRSTLNLPVIVGVFDAENDREPTFITAGITQDVSCEGLAVACERPIPDGEVVVGIGKKADWSVLRCQALRSTSIGFGFFLSGLQVIEVLPNHHFDALKEFARLRERQANQLSELVPA